MFLEQSSVTQGSTQLRRKLNLVRNQHLHKELHALTVVNMNKTLV